MFCRWNTFGNPSVIGGYLFPVLYIIITICTVTNILAQYSKDKQRSNSCGISGPQCVHFQLWGRLSDFSSAFVWRLSPMPAPSVLNVILYFDWLLLLLLKCSSKPVFCCYNPGSPLRCRWTSYHFIDEQTESDKPVSFLHMSSVSFRMVLSVILTVLQMVEQMEVVETAHWVMGWVSMCMTRFEPGPCCIERNVDALVSASVSLPLSKEKNPYIHWPP